IASRCQGVRFDPLPPAQIAAKLEGLEPAHSQACARLALGDALLALRLASEEGHALRACDENFVRYGMNGESSEPHWIGLLDLGKTAGEAAGEQVHARLEEELELV